MTKTVSASAFRIPRLVLVAGAFASLLARAPPVAAQAPAEASRLRILLVLNTKTRNAHKLGIDLDGLRLRRALEAGLRQQHLQRRYTLDVLTGDEVTRKQVLDYYRRLKADPTEALLFYYAGHGNLSKDGEHRLALRGGPLDRSELRHAMARHNTRLLVILTECCANVRGRRVTLPRVAPRRIRRGAVFRRVVRGRGQALRDLFFRHRGVVDVNASEVGRPAYGSRRRGGGFFTVALGTLLTEPAARFDANRDGLVSWPEFFAVLARGTKHVAARSNRYQVPAAFSLARP